MDEIQHKKVSPPFEGGVVGTIDYHIYTVFYFPTRVVDSLISSSPLLVTKTKTSSTGVKINLHVKNNQPPRPVLVFVS